MMSVVYDCQRQMEEKEEDKEDEAEMLRTIPKLNKIPHS